jgi:hypothetical protein
MLVEITIAMMIFQDPSYGVQIDTHMVTVGRATQEQCFAELDAIRAEWPGLKVVSGSCLLDEVDLAVPLEHPPIPDEPAAHVPQEDEA